LIGAAAEAFDAAPPTNPLDAAHAAKAKWAMT